jgi:hypothetical protein
MMSIQIYHISPMSTQFTVYCRGVSIKRSIAGCDSSGFVSIFVNRTCGSRV